MFKIVKIRGNRTNSIHEKVNENNPLETIEVEKSYGLAHFTCEHIVIAGFASRILSLLPRKRHHIGIFVLGLATKHPGKSGLLCHEAVEEKSL